MKSALALALTLRRASAARSACASALVVVTMLCAAPARAIQPLALFVQASTEANADLQIARSTSIQRDAEADRSTGLLLPSFTAQGTYTRNQYEVAFPAGALMMGASGTIVILPQNQLDGSLQLSVPILDVGAWERRSAARAVLEGSKSDIENMRADVARRVTRAYFQLIANEALLVAAQKALDVSRANETLVNDRKGGGTATELDVQRANADVARAEQDLSAATFAVVTGRRSLESLSGLTPEPASQFPIDDLHEEASLERWLSHSAELPAVKSAQSAERSADASVNAAKSAWLPTVSANATEHFTNAPSLTLHKTYYTLQATAVWRLDATIPAAERAQRAAAITSATRARATKRNAEDAIFQDYYQVRSSIDKSRSARTQVQAAAAAADLARDRFGGGLATQLDVLQAEQDLFKAEVARIQADADLAYARAALRLDASGPEGTTP
ncbi:MAG TPA: TolC family protein [Polyangiaceae bacterium]|jgi:outer membrane protein TolC